MAQNKTVESLNHLLADTMVLAQKVRKAHWNVKCSGFAAFHTWLGEVYNQLSDQADVIAERVRQLNDFPTATLIEYIEDSRLSEKASVLDKQSDVINTLTVDVNMVITSITNSLKEPMDEGTANLLADLLLKHEKLQWFLKAHQ